MIVINGTVGQATDKAADHDGRWRVSAVPGLALPLLGLLEPPQRTQLFLRRLAARFPHRLDRPGNLSPLIRPTSQNPTFLTKPRRNLMMRFQKPKNTSSQIFRKLVKEKVRLASGRGAAGDSEITLDTKVVTLVDLHIDRLEEDGRAVRTIDTYRYCAKLLAKIIAGVRIGEATPPRIDAAIRPMRRAHGDVMALQSKTILKGGLHLAVMANVLGSNPVRDVSTFRAKARPKGAPALTAQELRDLLAKLRASDAVQRHDLLDPNILFIATGLRISELLGLYWTDFDQSAATLTVSGKVIRAAGKGLLRIDETKTAAGHRTLPLPTFAVAVLAARRDLPYLGQQEMIFPSGAGTWRDPDNFRARWREVRADLGVPDVTSHSFRKSVATLIDDEGLSARIGADHLGHARISETMDTYMARGRSHKAVADLLDRAISAK